MAAVSAWSKPGAWALDAEAGDAADNDSSDFPTAAAAHKPSDDFPSLAAAAATKTKKKKPQAMSLAELHSAPAPAPGRFFSSASRGSTTTEILALPTGPRERTTEELERSSRGFGYSSYGRSRGEDPNPRSGGPRASDEGHRGGPGGGFDRDSGPSRADEIDDWGAMKRSAGPPPMSERRERGGFFGDSQSKADESDSWISNKATPPPPSGGRRIDSGGFDAPRERRGGLDMFNKEGLPISGADSDTWGRKREENSSGMSSDAWGRKREENISGVDSDTWGRKREELSSGGGRPRIVLQPRTRPPADVNNNNSEDGEPNRGEQLVSAVKSKGSNPFGEARPREEVLKEKGEDWKKIDEKLDSMKIRELPPEGQSFGRKGFGTGNDLGGAPEDTVERAWRKPDSTEDRAWRKPESTEERAWRKPDSIEERARKKPDATEPRAWRKPDTTEAPPPRMESS